MKVTVLGPNGINDATFHVHAKGCADVHKPKYRYTEGYRGEDAWDIDADTKQAIIEDLFSDFIGTGETQRADGTYTTWEDYENEARIFPCVGSLN